MTDDSPEERRCRFIFDKTAFPAFNDDYPRFRDYAKLIGAYESRRYPLIKFEYWYLLQHHPSFIRD